MARTKFPMLAVVLLIFGIAWLLNELKVFNLDLPWGPVIIIIIAIGLIFNRFSR
ncbi:MAG: hypothetical protein KKF68_00025 [Nanoarchaeota archaeon]|nr:hypothetical protein [Nanoarchaeota archaeon]